jgi:hypothetical protein
MIIYGIQLKEDATLADIIALLNMMNLTTNLEKVAEGLKGFPGVVLNKIEIPEKSENKNDEQKSGSAKSESAAPGASA